MATRAVRVVISGRVQGVFFRATTRRKARELGLRGYVRNCPDGTVEAIAAGPESEIGRFISFCSEGSSAARVEGVEVRDIPEEEIPVDEGFEIRY